MNCKTNSNTRHKLPGMYRRMKERIMPSVAMLFIASAAHGQVLTVTGTVNPASCSDVPDGSVELSASGCPGPYTYTWNGSPVTGNRVSNLAPGTYTAEARNAPGSVTDRDTIHYDDFQNSSAWNLDANASNAWTINDVYAGGSLLGQLTIPDVPSQPSSFGTPNQNYLHPVSIIADFFGISNSNYELTGSAGARIYAVMTQNLNTTGYDDITVSFWRTGGIGGFDLVYSTDGGASWQVARSYSDNPVTWIADSVKIPQIAGIAQARIGFSFDESMSADPGSLPYFSVDELRIIGEKYSVQPCTGSMQITITAGNNPPVGGFTYVSTGLKVDFTTTATAASGYSWDFGSSDLGNTSTNPNPSHTYSRKGTYEVKQIALNACGSDTVIMPILVYPASVDEASRISGISVFPNPVTDVMTVSLEGAQQTGPVSLFISDLAGRRLFSRSYPAGQRLITENMSGLPAGIYNLQIVASDGRSEQSLFMRD